MYCYEIKSRHGRQSQEPFRFISRCFITVLVIRIESLIIILDPRRVSLTMDKLRFEWIILFSQSIWWWWDIYVICHLSNWSLIASIESLIDQLVVLTLTDHCFLWNYIACKISQNIRHKNWSLNNFRVRILQSRKPRNSGRQLHWQCKMSSVLASPTPDGGQGEKRLNRLTARRGVGRRDGDISDCFSADGKAK